MCARILSITAGSVITLTITWGTAGDRSRRSCAADGPSPGCGPLLFSRPRSVHRGRPLRGLLQPPPAAIGVGTVVTHHVLPGRQDLLDHFVDPLQRVQGHLRLARAGINGNRDVHLPLRGQPHVFLRHGDDTILAQALHTGPDARQHQAWIYVEGNQVIGSR